MKVKVYAKLNLTLTVGARQGKFHPVDSVVTSVDVFDTVQVSARSDRAVCVSCDVPFAENSAHRAATAFCAEFATYGANIDIRKNIPIGAGMGGSSADAAATVYCMCKLYGVDVHSPRVHALCARLGSDINFMLHGGLARMRGKGDDLTFAQAARQLYFLVRQFHKQLLTAEVFAAYDSLGSPSAALPSEELFALLTCGGNRSLTDSLLQQLCRNDLEPVVRQADSFAEPFVDAVRSHSCKSTMTGSGSAFFVPFVSLSAVQALQRELDGAGMPVRLCKAATRGIEEL